MMRWWLWIWGRIVDAPTNAVICSKYFSSAINSEISLDCTIAKVIELDSKILKEFIVDERDVCW